ncbi:MAG: hypothetical protein AAGM67_13000, partial [Bacteroidota bacterium]
PHHSPPTMAHLAVEKAPASMQELANSLDNSMHGQGLSMEVGHGHEANGLETQGSASMSASASLEAHHPMNAGMSMDHNTLLQSQQLEMDTSSALIDGVMHADPQMVELDMALPEGVDSWKLSELRNWLDVRNKPSYGKKEDLLERMKRLAAGETVADKRAYNRFQPSPSDTNHLGVENWKLSELRTYLETRNKPSYGKKEDLVKRIKKLVSGESIADKRAYKRKKKRSRDNFSDLLYLYPGIQTMYHILILISLCMTSCPPYRFGGYESHAFHGSHERPCRSQRSCCSCCSFSRSQSEFSLWKSCFVERSCSICSSAKSNVSSSAKINVLSSFCRLSKANKSSRVAFGPRVAFASCFVYIMFPFSFIKIFQNTSSLAPHGFAVK